MWTTFALGVLFCSALVLLPGTLQLLSLGLSVPASIAVAPVVSIAEFVAFGVAFGVVGVPVGWVHLFAGSMACCVLLAVLGKGRAATRGPSPVTLSVRLLALSLLVGVLACLLVYVRTLGSPEAFAQQFDNASHLNRIQTFLSTSRFSTIQASTSAQAPIRPMSDFVFYPSGWHVLAAMTSDAVGCSPAMSENVANSVILAVVWPMSVALFADELFPMTALLPSGWRSSPLPLQPSPGASSSLDPCMQTLRGMRFSPLTSCWPESSYTSRAAVREGALSLR